MIDSKAVVQEVQDQLLAIVHRGQDQVRKGQERVRKSQEQVRKGREVVSGAVRSGTELAKSVRPNVPGIKSLPSPAEVRAHAQELAGHAMTAQRKARHAATPYAEQALAAQRHLAGRVIEAATPFVAEGRTRLNQVVGTLQDGRKPGRVTTAARPAPTADEQSERLADSAATPKAAKPRARAAKPAAAKTGTTKPASTTTKPRAAKTTSAKPASTSRTVKK